MRKSKAGISDCVLAAAAVAAALLLNNIARADTVASAPDIAATSVAAAPAMPRLSQLLSRVSIDYLVKFDGPALAHFDSRMTDDNYGQISDPSSGNKLLLEHAFRPSYKLNDNGLSVGAGINYWSFVTRGLDLEMQDSYVRIQHAKLVHVGTFNINQDFRIGLPLSTAAHNNSELGYLRTVQVISFDIPGTKWSLGSLNSFRVYKLGDGADKKLAKAGVPSQNLQDADMFVYPNVTYQATATLALNAGYEFDAYHNYGDRALNLTDAGFGMGGTSAGSVGFSWDATPKINVSPFLNVPLGESVSQGTSLGAYLSAKLM